MSLSPWSLYRIELKTKSRALTVSWQEKQVLCTASSAGLPSSISPYKVRPCRRHRYWTKGHNGDVKTGPAMSALTPKDGVIGRQCCGELKILGAALQADGETRFVVTASSIRRRSAAWTILLDWTFRSRRRASALWMTRARSFGKRRW